MNGCDQIREAVKDELERINNLIRSGRADEAHERIVEFAAAQTGALPFKEQPAPSSEAAESEEASEVGEMEVGESEDESYDAYVLRRANEEKMRYRR